MSSMIFASALAATSRSHQAQLSAQNASATAAATRTKTDLMQADVEKLLMITEALWSILKEHHGYTDDHLGQMMQDIDLRDGKLDGKVAKQQNQACPECGRILIGKHPVCLYCGTAVVRAPFER
jgi:ribosomal protein S27AE